MKTGLIFLILANLIGTPAPAENYSAPMGGEAAEYMLSEIIAENYSEQLDFNGDGQLNIADYYSTMRRYYVNTTEGNEVTADYETAYAIAENLYQEEIIYWEYHYPDEYGMNYGKNAEMTATEVTEATLYIEFEDFGYYIPIEVDPFSETIRVKEEET